MGVEPGKVLDGCIIAGLGNTCGAKKGQRRQKEQGPRPCIGGGGMSRRSCFRV